MGLPMFKDPEEIDAQQTATKVEKAAATRRSTIRRESTVRPRRYNTTAILNRDIPQDGPQPHRSPFVDANDEIQHLEAELERLRRHRIRSRSTRSNFDNLSVPMFGSGIDAFDVALDVSSRGSSQDRPTPQLPQPPRESALRFEFGPSRSGATSPRRHRITRRVLPSPPHSHDSDGRLRDLPDGPVRIPADGPAELTSDFAPARGPFRETPQPSEGMSRVVIEHVNTEDGTASLETPPPENWEASYPPLRRVGHMSARSQSPQYDGLGDRHRSPTPNSPNSSESIVNEDHWETLLTTMDDDDDLRRSIQPSFSSTSRSDSANGSNRSSQTTATSFGEIGQLDDACDLDLPQGITEDDVREIREQHRGTRAVQSMMNEVYRRSEGINNGTGPRTGMVMFQSLLERMSRREDIPEEWWAAAGLARTVRENA